MENKKITDLLYKLAQLDVDAVGAYKQALQNIDQEKDKEVFDNITQFCLDHEKHITDLNVLMIQYGASPIERSPDFKGYLIEGFTAVRSLTGTKGALNAMETNEQLTNKTYKNAISSNPDLPVDVRALLDKNYGDEQVHLDYIRQALNVMKVTS